MGKFIDYTGQKINKWNIISFNKFNEHGESTWDVCCDCSEEKIYTKTLSSIKRSKYGCSNCVNLKKIEERKKEIIGQSYGKLTIVKYIGTRKDISSKNPHWEAMCSCGSNKKIIATLYDIKSGRVKSCGCSKQEYEYIENLKKIGSRRKNFNQYIEFEDYYKVICSNGEFYIDKDDKDKILNMNVCFYIKDGYVYGKNNKIGEFQLHRTIMNLSKFDNKKNIIVDHIDGNRNNNRKSNLRIIDKKYNAINCDIYSNNTSGIKGVSFHKKTNKWQVTLQIENVNKYLGIYETIEEAKQVRLDAEIKYFGSFRREM